MSRQWFKAERIGIVCMLVAAVPALADQSTQRGSPSDIDEIMVTARRVEESVNKVPVAVSVLDAERLEALAINTPLDLNKIAGLGGAPIGSLTAVNFSLRGQGTAFGGQPGVIAYFAEVPGFPLAYFDLQNVQAIKGPQGTLFGQTSTGGVVLFEPRRPTDRWEGYLDLEGGDHAYGQLQGAVNLPLFDDRLSLRAAVQVRERDGWATAVYSYGNRRNRDLNDLDSESFRISASWKVTDALENYTIYAQSTVRNNGTSSPLYYIDPRFMNPAVRNVAPSASPAMAAAWQFWAGYAPPPGQTFSQLLTTAYEQQLAAGPLVMYTDYSQRNTTVNKGWINQTTWDIQPDLRVRNIVGLRWQTVQGAIYDQDATNLPLLDFQCRYVPGTTSADGSCAKTGGWPERTLTEEIQLQGTSFGERLQWQVGAFYLRGGVREFRENSRPLIVLGSLTGDPASAAFCNSVNVASPCASMARTDTHSEAIFAQGTYALTPGVHVTAGYRTTWDYTRTDTTGKASYRVPFNGQWIAIPVYGESPAAGATHVSTVVDLPANASYNVSADWQASDQTLLYVAHRSGYKTGGINSTANPGTPQRTYGPERAKDIEIGAKTAWAIGGLRGELNVDVYHTWYTDIQEGEIIPGTAQAITTNLANAGIDGLELEGTLYAGEWFRLSGHLAFTDAQYSNWLEHSTCAAQYWRPQCAGMPTNTAITIDHSGGSLDVAGQTIRFKPDRFANTSRWQWSIQPALLLAHWIGEDVTVGVNVYHRGPYVDSVAVANTSKIAGLSPMPRDTVFGYSTSNPYDARGYTLGDVRVDWRRMLGTRISIGAGVTNVTDEIYRVSSASSFEVIGDVYSITGEPRMAFAQVKYEF